MTNITLRFPTLEAADLWMHEQKELVVGKLLCMYQSEPEKIGVVRYRMPSPRSAKLEAINEEAAQYGCTSILLEYIPKSITMARGR